MSAIVEYCFYNNIYKGSEVDQASFPALCAHATRMVAAMCRWQVDEDNFSELTSLQQNLYRLAICSQIDFLSVNGLDSINDTGGGGFTVGKVTVHGKSSSGAGGAMSASISPATTLYLEQSGLMYPGVGVAQC
jgi:hypothetical protein